MTHKKRNIQTNLRIFEKFYCSRCSSSICFLPKSSLISLHRKCFSDTWREKDLSPRYPPPQSEGYRLKTRMHSSRMRASRCSGLHKIERGGGVSVLGGLCPGSLCPVTETYTFSPLWTDRHL